MSATEYDVMQEAQEIRRGRLDALGLGDQYDLWRESLPNGRDMSEQEAYNAFMEAQSLESAALDGRVSVSTGGADAVPTTDIPTPGPDGEDTGTDAPGDTSEGAPEGTGEPGDLSKLILGQPIGRDTELKPVEGMWLPPKESEALNYIEPTTEQIAASPDWIDNARVVWKAMGSPHPERERAKVRTTPWMQPPTMDPFEAPFMGAGFPDMSDRQIGEWARRELSLFTWNVASTLSYAHKIMTSEDPKLALAFLNLINMYEHSDGGSVEFTRALLGIATDPTTYVGLGVGTIAARGAAKALAKSELKKAIQMGIIGGTAGAFEGGTLAGGFDLVVQNIEQEAGARQDIDYGRSALATTVGIGAGATLGGSVGGLIGRRMDKIAAMHDEIQRLVEGTRALETERAAAGTLTESQMIEQLQASQKASAAAGQQDASEAILIKFLDEEGNIPRNPDGTIDEIAFAEAVQAHHDLQKGFEPHMLGPEGGMPVEEFVAQGRPKDMSDADWELFQALADPGVHRGRDFEKARYSTVTDKKTGNLIIDRRMFGDEAAGEPFDVDMSIETIDKILASAKRAGVKADIFPRPSGKFGGLPNGYFEISGDDASMAKFMDDLLGPEKIGTLGPTGQGEIAVRAGVTIGPSTTPGKGESITFTSEALIDPDHATILDAVALDKGMVASADVTVGDAPGTAGSPDTYTYSGTLEDVAFLNRVDEHLVALRTILETTEQGTPEWGKAHGELAKWLKSTTEVSELAADIPIPKVPRRTTDKDYEDVDKLLADAEAERTAGTRPLSANDEVFVNEMIRQLQAPENLGIQEVEDAIKYMRATSRLPRKADGTLDDVAVSEDLDLIRRGEEPIQRREVILSGRLGGRPFTVEEGLARGLNDEEIAKLEMNPINVVDKLERAGFKVTLGEEGDIVFDATNMSPANAERIERIAAQTGVKATPFGALRPQVPIPPDRIIQIGGWPEDPVDRLLAEAYATETGGPGVKGDKARAKKMQEWLHARNKEDGGELVVKAEDGTELYRGIDLQAADKAWRKGNRQDKHPTTEHTTERGDFDPIEAFEPEAQGLIAISGDPVDIARFGGRMTEEVTPARLPAAESRAFARRIMEMEKTIGEEVVAKTASLPGSHVRGLALGTEFEVMGRTKNGWYHLRNKLTGEEVNRRRNQFEVIESRPKPTMAGPMELTPFTTSAARIMAMNEDILSGKLKAVKITTAEQRAIVDDLRRMGIKIDEKSLASHWSPAELLFLRDTYNAQAKGMHNLARVLGVDLENNGRLTDQQMAMFNEAHTQFVATRDLFFGVSGNAARQLQILKTRSTDEVYEFSQAIMDSLSISGGRANTERAITMMAEFADDAGRKPGQTTTGAITKMSNDIWGTKVSAGLLIVRYNMMLSSWRTHFFNWLGNSASGVYQHLAVNPVKMGINNMAHARDLALSVLDPRFAPDPADRLRWHSYWAGTRSHYASARDSFMLAKEIAMGRDIGEGKVWNELGLRYNVINVPDSAFAKLGTTPVRLLEAGDAFFKNQYYMSKIHELASIKARAESVHKGMDFQTQYQTHVDGPDAPMQRQAKEYAAKQTYTNDPNVYGGILAALARGAASAQQRNIAVNMILPFVRTPANLLSYSMEMIGANTLLAPGTTYNAIMKGTAAESQEAMSRLTVAAGLWIWVHDMYQNGDITGAGPPTWEERKVQEAAGWQANSIRIYGKLYDISRADPAGQSLATIATVFDYYALTKEDRKPALEWIGAGLLNTADMLIDESYLSTVSDVITAISSKEEARLRSVSASLVNSVMIPNLIRDLRRPTDPTRRSGASENFMDQVVKQMKNASPWLSEDLPPQRDWKGDPVNYYGNAYARGFIPFDMRNPEDADPASMALAYARIPVSTPNRSIEWPRGQGDGIDLFAMDDGDGFIYDKYVEIMGKARGRTVNELMSKAIWRQMVKENNIGPGSDGDNALRRVLAIGSRNGRLQMLEFLIDHSGDNNSFRRGNGDLILIHHPVSIGEYKRLRQMVRGQDIPVPEELRQYEIQERREGPEFFKPRTPE